MNNYFKINRDDSDKVKNLLEKENIAYVCHTNMASMVTLENNFHVSECGKYILSESRVFEEGSEGQLLHSNLDVLKCENDNISIFVNEETIDDVWSFRDWKQVSKK